MNVAGDTPGFVMGCKQRLKRAAFVAALALLGTLQAFVSTPSQAQPVVTGVRIGDHAQSTRFVMDLDKHVDFHVFALADPYRIVLDLPELSWKISSAKKVAGKGLVIGTDA